MTCCSCVHSEASIWAPVLVWSRCPCLPVAGMTPATTACLPGTPSVAGMGRCVWRCGHAQRGERTHTHTLRCSVCCGVLQSGGGVRSKQSLIIKKWREKKVTHVDGQPKRRRNESLSSGKTVQGVNPERATRVLASFTSTEEPGQAQVQVVQGALRGRRG